MKKLIIGVVAAVIIGAGWWLGSPLFLDKDVNEDLPGVSTESENEESETKDDVGQDHTETERPVETTEVYKGNFKDADEKHKASGTVKTINADDGTYLRFEEFNATNGPDLYVYLAREGQPTKEGIELGKLKGNKGDQNYQIPEGIDLTEFNTVVIWCKAFDEDFGYALLSRE